MILTTLKYIKLKEIMVRNVVNSSIQPRWIYNTFIIKDTFKNLDYEYQL